MPETTRSHDLPELSPAARGLCGAFFSDGRRSVLQLGLAPADHVQALDELLTKGVVHRHGPRALRGTEVAAAVGWSVMLRADEGAPAEGLSPAAPPTGVRRRGRPPRP